MINIGLVYDETNKIDKELGRLLHYLEKQGAWVLDACVSLDEDGEKWVGNNQKELDYALLTRYYYGEVSVCLKVCHGMKEIPIQISIQKEQQFFGFVLSFDEIRFEEVGIDRLEDIAIQFMRQLTNVTHFQYAFCDYDSEIELHPKQKKQIDSGYAIVYWHGEEVMKNSWKIDGLTARGKEE
ncbi:MULTISPECIES: Imm64 family immunity protein [Exiguobacterium]|uniref:Imm64 family immunity protein n=1 Tax=Exiguobacterium antarcticum TaxID=132920 RepID=A0ABT6R1T5_9BACL|nr:MULTISPECIES: Imm64 family immunity protein [Exiguobacterium]AFS69307.1 alkylphosphonate utilization protein [Exiguobacterium antarcticum B7]MCT4780620.1 Imm64 family immunity protein [Exiguobacterium soli]MDI3234908.1 Imm64 family immunity protein [Exiguobacterium antarcticum]